MLPLPTMYQTNYINRQNDFKCTYKTRKFKYKKKNIRLNSSSKKCINILFKIAIAKNIDFITTIQTFKYLFKKHKIFIDEIC